VIILVQQHGAISTGGSFCRNNMKKNLHGDHSGVTTLSNIYRVIILLQQHEAITTGGTFGAIA